MTSCRSPETTLVPLAETGPAPCEPYTTISPTANLIRNSVRELGGLLVRRGHRVRIFGPAELASSIGEAGCVHRPSPPEVDELDMSRRAEDQWEALRRVWSGRELADAFVAELEREPAGAVVVDYPLRSVAAAVKRVGVPTALLVHTIYGFHGGAEDDEETRQRWYEPVNVAGRARP